jgi:hypothetical protein
MAMNGMFGEAVIAHFKPCLETKEEIVKPAMIKTTDHSNAICGTLLFNLPT